MSHSRRVLLALAITSLTASAWFFRHDVEHLRGLVVVKHDRWTGRTFYCEPEGCYEPRFVDISKLIAIPGGAAPRDLFAETEHLFSNDDGEVSKKSRIE